MISQSKVVNGLANNKIIFKVQVIYLELKLKLNSSNNKWVLTFLRIINSFLISWIILINIKLIKAEIILLLNNSIFKAILLMDYGKVTKKCLEWKIEIRNYIIRLNLKLMFI